MKYTVLTLFPQLIRPWTEEALLGRAVKAGLVSFDVRDLRDYAGNRHRRVDDTPYGGGAGMVVRVDVAARALADVTPPPFNVRTRVHEYGGGVAIWFQLQHVHPVHVRLDQVAAEGECR